MYLYRWHQAQVVKTRFATLDNVEVKQWRHRHYLELSFDSMSSLIYFQCICMISSFFLTIILVSSTCVISFFFFFYMFHFSLLRVNYSSKQDIRIGPFPETICLYNSCFKKNSTKPCPVLYLKLGSKRTMDMTGVTAQKNTGFKIGFCDSCPSSP